MHKGCEPCGMQPARPVEAKASFPGFSVNFTFYNFLCVTFFFSTRNEIEDERNKPLVPEGVGNAFPRVTGVLAKSRKLHIHILLKCLQAVCILGDAYCFFLNSSAVFTSYALRTKRGEAQGT